VFVDTETTGLDLDRDEVIELALLAFDYDRATGRILRVRTNHALSAFRQPSIPTPAASTRVHGITDAQVAGHVIDPEQVRSAIDDAHLIIAHNAAFDRPMVEKHWPIFENKHWAWLACRYRLEERGADELEARVPADAAGLVS
jgi:DNA polymerase-3 subunit epsilon